MRLKRLRADSQGTPTARGRQCKAPKKDKRRARGEHRRLKNKIQKSISIKKLGEP